jgi:glycosyltransferase involved in cell wall biosynthesis
MPGEPPSPRSAVLRLSVVVTSFDRREYLLDAIGSVRDQTLERSACEILVAKNFTDPEIDAELARVGALSVPVVGPNHGDWLARAFERGTGDVFVFLDDDDRMLPDRLEVVRGEFERDPSLLYFHHGLRTIDRAGKSAPPGVDPTADRFRGTRRIRVGPDERSPEVLDSAWNSGGAFNLSCIAVRRSLLKRCLGPLRRIRASSSAFLYFAALASPGSLLIDPEARTEYRIHPGNLSAVLAPTRNLRWRRELRRAEWVIQDSDVTLEFLAERNIPPVVSRRLRVTKLRYGLLLRAADPGTPARRLISQMTRLTLASVPGYLGGTVGYLRLGVSAMIGRFPRGAEE